MRAKRRASSRKARISVLSLVFALAVLFIAGNQWENFSSSRKGGAAAFDVSLREGDGRAQVFFLDVGQGDSELIRVPGESGYFNVLLDTGEAEYAEGLADFLRSLGIERIDVLLESHPHSDHMGGMYRIVEEFEIGSVYLPRVPEEQTPTSKAYEKLLDSIERKGLVISQLHADASIEAPGLASFQVLAPEKTQVWEELNNYSAVIRFSYGENTFLFPGDAESEVEKALLEEERELSAQVLKCGHHGSKTSSTADFLRAVSPSYAVISCGADNSYGHPHKGTLQKLSKLSSEVFRTDEDGTILMLSDGEDLTVKTGLASVKAQ